MLNYRNTNNVQMNGDIYKHFETSLQLFQLKDHLQKQL
jgi:hypothetical protein